MKLTYRIISFSCAVFLTLSGATFVFTQEKRTMALVDLLEVPSLRDPQLSPNGNQLLYVQADADWKANKQISQRNRSPANHERCRR